MTLTVHLLLVCLVYCTFAAALTIRNCINGQVEVYEDDGTVVTCSDIANPSDVVWRRGVGGEAIGECKADGTCSPVYLYHDYALSRAPYSSDSRLTIVRDYRANGGLEVTCQQMGSTSSARCKLVIKHHSVLNQCKITTDTERWTVSGVCQVQQAFASDNSYTCQWTGPNNNVFGAFEDGSTHQVCSFTQPLPNQEGLYTYRVSVSPASTNQFSQDVRIAAPGSMATSCSWKIPEGGNVSCVCRIEHPGSPPAVVRWQGQDGDLMIMSDVQREDNGTQFECHVTWGGGIYTSAVYTLLVEYESHESTVTSSQLSSSHLPSTLPTPTISPPGIRDCAVMASVYNSDPPMPPEFSSEAVISSVAAFVVLVFIIHVAILAIRRRREGMKAIQREKEEPGGTSDSLSW
ncbi:uncharacterized protein LOC112568190 [Pomacea canaliculata]|uniref:uncharacterized protein LOC112568190 n=1 Tax=Pomacea canaliculata TaxID=400727 RepID=UPI000D72F3B1|nr:uncharacterized protein LOC112568190 [Pomacea canaliculata]